VVTVTPSLSSLVFIGDQPLVVQCAVMARTAGHDVGLVASIRPEIRERAASEGLPAISSEALGSELGEGRTDVLFSIANQFLLPDELLTRFTTVIGFHDGLLPNYAGPAATTWSLMNGETRHGVTWHRVGTGPSTHVVHSEVFDIAPDETAFSLDTRCYEVALDTFPKVLSKLGDSGISVGASGARPERDRRPLVFVDPSTPAAQLGRSIRALDVGSRNVNGVGVARLLFGDDALAVGEAHLTDPSGQPVGAVSATEQGIRITTVEGDLVVRQLSTMEGEVVSVDDATRRVGTLLPVPGARLVEALKRTDARLARHEAFWTSRLSRFESSQPTHLPGATTGNWIDLDAAVDVDATREEIATGVLAWWARTSGVATTWFEFSDAEVESALTDLRPVARRPLGRFVTREGLDWMSARSDVASELRELSSRGPFLRDLVGRIPSLRGVSVHPMLRVHIGSVDDEPSPTALLEAVIPPTGGGLRLRVRETVSADLLSRIGEQVLALIEAGRHGEHQPIATLDLIGPRERALLQEWNNTAIPFERSSTLDAQFRRQVAMTPTAPAVSCRATTLTYEELERAVDEFEAQLRGAGARHGSLVGIAVERDIDLLVAVLAVLSLGAAYVPLDPEYPEDRLAFMVADSGLAVMVADSDVVARIAGPDIAVVKPGRVPGPAQSGEQGAGSPHTSEDLAYVIYTSGSTGRPKGVMLEHRNVLNFFAAMDEVIEHDEPGTWLAVTSLSFDISVLELLWTITRGFHVVIQKHGITSPLAPVRMEQTSATLIRPTSLSLFFFAAGDSQATDGYRLLRESAQFADRHGFEAVWLPERHFHEFGGAYPNPSVLASAIAVLTDRIAIRAGSVVLPLHSSARVAEEWSVVDNLSGGRVGMSVAPGWQPNDFVLNPTGFATAREDLQSRIDEVCALWRGESVAMIGPDDRVVDVKTLPRPVQSEIPLWLTSAGSTATFEKAGELGLNLLTHLLGQSIEQLAENIAVYRAAWTAAGHTGEGHVTVMLHTFLNGDRALAFQLAEEPMKRYLGSAAGLLKHMASAFPIFANASASADEAFRSLSESEMDELLTMAAGRYLNTSGLFGDLDDARQMALDLSRMGVDEIACLIDFGLETDDVLRSLPLLSRLQSVLAADAEARSVIDVVPSDAGGPDHSSEAFADLVGRHAVTHVQCTPSLAAMLMADPRDRLALKSISHLMVGGEALPEKLCRELRAAVSGRLTNMYGPTETTIWSLVHEIDAATDGPVPIGRPIGNNTVHILDAAGEVLPVGALGELHIGGDGVARGYLGREELTSQRFVDRPDMGRVYATGDLARIGGDGVVEFAGRVDFQVKIRGHRIELGEIEARLDLHPSVQRSVVVARGEAADARLVAFVVPAPHADLDAELLRKHVASTLPDVMVPDFVVELPELPLTPNGKVDRAALPADIEQLLTPVLPVDLVAPENDVERMVAAVWADHLKRPVGRAENFFDIGGNSLLAVAVFRGLQDNTDVPIALTDVFRYPTVASFAAHLRQRGAPDGESTAAGSTPHAGVDRGERRRKLLERRRG
jgi:natural product biosynthesis luciferase-like monooxygenase protein